MWIIGIIVAIVFLAFFFGRKNPQQAAASEPKMSYEAYDKERWDSGKLTPLMEKAQANNMSFQEYRQLKAGMRGESSELPASSQSSELAKEREELAVKRENEIRNEAEQRCIPIDEVSEEWDRRESERRERIERLKNQLQEEAAAREEQLRAASAGGSQGVRCPKCGSTQITADKKGFGLGKAVIGTALIGVPGLLSGFAGSRKVQVTCLQCGKSWTAGSH